MPIPTTGFCTDEDIAIRAGDDFARLVIADQSLAGGNDGVFASNDLWTLSSASNSFVTQGVTAKMIALVTLPKRGGTPPKQAFAIDSVAAGSITLRRKGATTGQGQAPSPVGGFGQIEFSVPSCKPQILTASYDIQRRYGMDDTILGRRTADLYDPDELRNATVLTVLWKLYQVAPPCEGDKADNSKTSKANAVKNELDEVLARLQVHWNSIVAGYQNAQRSSRFSTRLSR